MYSLSSLDIKGYQGKPIRNTLFRQQREASEIAIVFPGYGYPCFGPVIYYPSLALLSSGSDVLWVEYAYNREPEFRAAKPAQRRE